MKKGIIILFLIILLPYIILLFFYHEKNNTLFVKVKTNKKVISVPLEEYIVGVVAGEMPAEFNIEALKAQAVAARSYVLNKIEKNNSYDVTDNTLTQVYLNKSKLKEKWKSNYSINLEKIKQVVNDTKGEVLVYDDKIIEALFFSTSPGYTENASEVFSSDRPYLRSVSSTWDDISPTFSEINYFSKEDFCKKMDIICNDLNIEIIEKTSTGRSKKIKVNNEVFSSDEFIKKLNLRSSFLDIKILDSNVVIETKGYGHGVGMSQYGAQALALNSYKYEEILKYYYQNTQIKKIEV